MLLPLLQALHSLAVLGNHPGWWNCSARDGAVSMDERRGWFRSSQWPTVSSECFAELNIWVRQDENLVACISYRIELPEFFIRPFVLISINKYLVGPIETHLANRFFQFPQGITVFVKLIGRVQPC